MWWAEPLQVPLIVAAGSGWTEQEPVHCEGWGGEEGGGRGEGRVRGVGERGGEGNGAEIGGEEWGGR